MAQRQWLLDSLLGMLILVPGWLSIGFFKRNYNVGPDLLLVWYFLGGSLGALFLGRTPMTASVLVPSWGIVISLVVLGILVCGYSNLLIFRGVAHAPNPGLAVSLANSASVIVFFAAALLATWMPRYFDAVHVSGKSFLGVVLTIIGASLIAL